MQSCGAAPSDRDHYQHFRKPVCPHVLHSRPGLVMCSTTAAFAPLWIRDGHYSFFTTLQKFTKVNRQFKDKVERRKSTHSCFCWWRTGSEGFLLKISDLVDVKYLFVTVSRNPYIMLRQARENQHVIQMIRREIYYLFRHLVPLSSRTRY